MPQTAKPQHEKPYDMSRMDLKQLENLVGRPPSAVDVHGRWVVCRFDNCTVRFIKW